MAMKTAMLAHVRRSQHCIVAEIVIMRSQSSIEGLGRRRSADRWESLSID
jgi:hypothetical protein